MKTNFTEKDLTKTDFTKYNIDYLGVHCSGVKWRKDEPSTYRLSVGVEEFEFTPSETLPCIRCLSNIESVIEDYFIPWYEEQSKNEETEEEPKLRHFRILSTFRAPKYLSPCFNTTDVSIDSSFTKEVMEEIGNSIRASIEQSEPELTDFNILSWSEFENE